MDVNELQKFLDELFPDGARFNNNAGAYDSFIFWVARPVALTESAILVKPVGSEFMVPYTFEGAPQVDYEGGSVAFTSDSAGSLRFLQFDSWFEPKGLEEAIAQERSEFNDEWVAVLRDDHKRGAL